MANKLLGKKGIGILLIFGLLILLAFLPTIITNAYILHLFIYTCIWIVMVSGLNVIQGYAGYVSLGHIAFYGLGAYTSGLLMTKLGMPLIVGLVAAVFIGIIIGTLIGLPTLRTKGHYFSIVTLSFAMLVNTLMINMFDLTNGILGFTIPKLKGSLFGLSLSTKEGFYYIAIVFALLTLLFVRRLFRSRTGRAIIAIRENENLAKSMGINTVGTKLLAFNISAVLACIGGVLFAHYINFVNPTSFDIGHGMNAILAVMIGGSGTVLGPVIGSFLIVFLPEMLRIADLYRQLVFGVLLIIIVLVLPHGINEPLSKLFRIIKKWVLSLKKSKKIV